MLHHAQVDAGAALLRFDQVGESSTAEAAPRVQFRTQPRSEDANPRTEAEEHYYNPVNTKLRDLGLEPHHLGEELVRSMLGIIERYSDRVIESAILPTTKWNPGEVLDPAPASEAAAE